jgi:Flp pilus assembly protein TadD
MRSKAGRVVAMLFATLVGCAVDSHAQTARQAPAPAAASTPGFEDAERALAAGRYEEAEKLYRDLARRMPGVAEVHAKLGVALFQEGKYAETVPELRRALALKPALPNLDALLAMSLSETGQPLHAIAIRRFDGSSDCTYRGLTWASGGTRMRLVWRWS